MVDYALLTHNDCLAEFNLQRYRKVLDISHVTDDGIIHFPEGRLTTGEKTELNFWGWIAIKNGVNYLIPRHDDQGNEHELENILPIVPNKWDTVSVKNKSYRKITHFTSVSFKKEKRLTMRQLIDRLSAASHTHPKHRKLLIMAVLSQVCSRAYFRFASRPGFGKDNVVDTFGALVGDCITLENPSIAKLELHAATKRVTGLNEVVGLSKAQWADIGKFILASAAFKSRISKRTLAHGVVGNEIDLREYSLSLFYNDITDYPDKNVIYFDKLAEGGIRDRLPALRLSGGFTYDFNKINEVNVSEFVEENWNEYMDIIYTILYFRENYPKCKYKFNLDSISSRWKRSLGVFFCVVSEYCNSQEEFDEWVKVVNDCIVDYRAMLEYPKLLSQAKEKRNFKSVVEKYLKPEDSFSSRVQVLLDFLTDKPVKDPAIKSIKGNW